MFGFELATVAIFGYLYVGLMMAIPYGKGPAQKFWVMTLWPTITARALAKGLGAFVRNL